jgi:hypothetical protein
VLPTSPDSNLRISSQEQASDQEPDYCPLNAAKPPQTQQTLTSPYRRHVFCLESRRSHVRLAKPARAPEAMRAAARKEGPRANALHSYNRYLTVASRVVRRSLKDDKRLIAEKRGESELRFAKWEVRTPGG